MKSPTSNKSQLVAEWIWTCGLVELILALWLGWVAVRRILDGPNLVSLGRYVVVIPLFALAGLVLVCALGCFLRWRWTLWVSTCLLAVSLVFLVPLLVMLASALSTGSWAIVLGFTVAVAVAICGVQLAIAFSLWKISRRWPKSTIPAWLPLLVCVGGGVVLDLATPRLHHWRKQAEFQRQDSLEDEAEGAVADYLRAAETGDVSAQHAAQTRLTTLSPQTHSRTVTVLTQQLKSPSRKRQAAAIDLVMQLELRPSNDAETRAVDRLIRYVRNRQNAIELRSRAVELTWRITRGDTHRSMPSLYSQLEALPDRRFAAEPLSRGLNVPQHQCADKVGICRFLGSLGPDAIAAVPELERAVAVRPEGLTAEEHAQLIREAETALATIRSNAIEAASTP